MSSFLKKWGGSTPPKQPAEQQVNDGPTTSEVITSPAPGAKMKKTHHYDEEQTAKVSLTGGI